MEAEESLMERLMTAIPATRERERERALSSN
jgi:hypothetical protein